ncbi:N-acetylglucosamine 6-phosphate deacetylase [Pseudarcicella hirudinis]|uniref:N-acetylglucosamine 6-phosphate deacetylase n=1 Tax=Pseudarcicella hirudinis TaxID=1079859 RepID=A0A1I5XK22_9BACT|nr:N-acetylglucosamine-6-phosphate deacetylase [Pseudarcicella hirudinis]SFQ32289.1 N-acetylglucosamine 6-phosphate deacetylase [Pseudarcicella hirudinis]
MQALKNGKIFSSDQIHQQKAVLTEGNKIIGIIDENEIPSHAEIIDLKGLSVSPSFIDLQVYGGGGSLFSSKPTEDSIEKTYIQHRKTGTSHFQITLNCSPTEMMWEAIESCKNYQKSGKKGLLGLHLEGPFFNPVKKGAHIESFIQKPTEAFIQQILEATEGLNTYMTIAPEMFTDAALKLLLDSPVKLSAGHSNATYYQAKEAFSKGIKRVTHLFNAMSPYQSRELGLVGAAYDSDVWASIIADGFHCDFPAVRVSKKIKGDKLFLITDAVTEDTSGDYKFTLANGKFVDSKGTLSGSALSMIEAIQNCVEKAGISLEESLKMASAYPAQVASVDHELGKIAPDYLAYLVLFTDDFQVKGLMENGVLEWFD